MASLTKDNRLQFTAPDGRRRTIQLGSKRKGQVVQRHVERLIDCKRHGCTPPEATLSWLDSVGDGLHKGLERAGLVDPKAKQVAHTLGELVELFRDRSKWRLLKPASQKTYNYGFRRLFDRYGAETPITQITDSMGKDFPGGLMESGLSKASTHGVCNTAAILFRFAVKSRLLDRNPFDEVPRGAVPTSRRAYIGADVFEDVLAELKGTQNRLTFALARWAGLRIPSEPSLLRWCDIDWERGRFLVRASKTERYVGHESRWVPLFPELVRFLSDRFSEAADGDELVLPVLASQSESAFRCRLRTAILRAGHDEWPRICHSLRATRQTELEQVYPTYVVCSWLGNSPRVAHQHYLQVTDEHFASATQIPTQHASARGRIEPKQGDCPVGDAL